MTELLHPIIRELLVMELHDARVLEHATDNLTAVLASYGIGEPAVVQALTAVAKVHARDVVNRVRRRTVFAELLELDALELVLLGARIVALTGIPFDPEARHKAEAQLAAVCTHCDVTGFDCRWSQRQGQSRACCPECTHG